MAGKVKVTGLRELRRSMEKGSDELKQFDRELVRLAEPVAQEAQIRGARYAGIGPYRTKRRRAGAVVEQTRRKVTGRRADFGVLQMRTVLIPALETRQDEVMRGVEDWLDTMLRREDL